MSLFLSPTGIKPLFLSFPVQRKDEIRVRGTRHRIGFTLVEMAVVLIVIGLIMLTVFPALTAVRSASQRSLTQSNLQALMRATASYIQANGCLPCPTPAGVTGNGFGRVRGDSSPAAAACGACPADPVNGLKNEGIPPFVSLGLPSSTAHDGWGNWVTMRTDPALTINFGIAPPTKVCSCTGPVGITCTPSSPACTCALSNGACTPSPANISAQGLCTANLSTSAGAIPINIYSLGSPTPQKVAVIFVSHGTSGDGSFSANALPVFINGLSGCRKSFTGNALGCPPLPICPTNGPLFCGTSLGTCLSQCNAAGTNQFIDAPTMDSYSDLLAYADRNTLVSMLGNGSCQTAW